MIDPDLSLLDVILSLLLPQLSQALSALPQEPLRRSYANGRIRVEVVVSADGPPGPPRPSWDGRVLRLGARELHRYRQPAENQTAILDAFNAAGWPERVGNPIRKGGTADPKALSDAVSELNKGLPPGTIRFSGDGAGDVAWRSE